MMNVEERATHLKDVFLSSVVLRLFLLVALVSIGLQLWSRRRLYALSMKLPGPMSFPIIGNSFDLGLITSHNNTFKYVHELKKRFDGLFRVWLGPELCIVIAEPEDMECVLLSKQTASKGPKYDIISTGIGEGLLTASGMKWKRHRHIINPSFSGICLKTYQSVHDKHGRHMAENLMKFCDDGLIDVSIHSLRCGADIISEALFGVEFHFYKCENDKWLHKIPIIADLFYERICKVWLWNDKMYQLSSSGKSMKKHLAEYRSFYWVTLNEKIEKYLVDKKPANLIKNDEYDFEEEVSMRVSKNSFELMMEGVLEGKLTIQEVVDEFDSIYNPGLDTIYTHMSFFILMMGMHKRCQDLVWNEIKEIFADDMDAPVTSEHMPKMHYLELCLKEISRLFPTGPIQMRYLDKDFYFKNRNLVVPAGVSLFLSNFALHRNSKYWKDPDLFIPERFLPESSSKRPYFAYMPFSAGLRNCIGQVFGYDLLKTVAIHMLRKLEFQSDLKMESLPLKADISVRSLLGYHVRISRRKYSD